MEAAEGTSAGPTPPPAPRPRLRSLVFPPLFGFGAGVMDLLFATHVVAVVMSLDGSALVGIGALAVGAAASIVAAPLVAAVSDQRLGGRAPLAVALNLSAGAAAAGVAGLAGMHSPSADGARYADGQEPAVAPLVAAVGLAAAYRCVTASSPSVPALIETAMARGEGAAFPARRDLILSFYYLWYRGGVFAAGLAVLHAPGGGGAPASGCSPTWVGAPQSPPRRWWPPPHRCAGRRVAAAAAEGRPRQPSGCGPRRGVICGRRWWLPPAPSTGCTSPLRWQGWRTAPLAR